MNREWMTFHDSLQNHIIRIGSDAEGIMMAEQMQERKYIRVSGTITCNVKGFVNHLFGRGRQVIWIQKILNTVGKDGTFCLKNGR